MGPPEPTSDEFRFMQTVPYGSLVDSLSYIAVVGRPDIARAVHSLQRAQNNPSHNHRQAALPTLVPDRILRRTLKRPLFIYLSIYLAPLLQIPMFWSWF